VWSSKGMELSSSGLVRTGVVHNIPSSIFPRLGSPQKLSSTHQRWQPRDFETGRSPEKWLAHRQKCHRALLEGIYPDLVRRRVLGLGASDWRPEAAFRQMPATSPLQVCWRRPLRASAPERRAAVPA